MLLTMVWVQNAHNINKNPLNYCFFFVGRIIKSLLMTYYRAWEIFFFGKRGWEIVVIIKNKNKNLYSEFWISDIFTGFWGPPEVGNKHTGHYLHHRLSWNTLRTFWIFLDSSCAHFLLLLWPSTTYPQQHYLHFLFSFPILSYR